MEFRLREASIYRAINAVKQSESQPELKTTKVILWLQVENNSKFVRGKGKSRQTSGITVSLVRCRKLEKMAGV